jgi:hypothetical protein
MNYGHIMGNQTPAVSLIIGPSKAILPGTSGICGALMDDPSNILHYPLFLPTSNIRISYLVKGVFV